MTIRRLLSRRTRLLRFKEHGKSHLLTFPVGQEKEMMKHVIAAFLTCLLSAACMTVPDRAYGVHDLEKIEGGTSKYMLVDISEDGNLACPGPDQKPFPCDSRLRRMGEWLASEPPGTPIIVFVHGWHHNGSPGDPNLEGFQEFLGRIEAVRQSSQEPAPAGVYVSWRGDQWQFLAPAQLQSFLDFPTIWSRKRASTRIGQGGLRTLIQSLRTHQADRAVIVIGHSLGASAIFYAVRDILEEDMLEGFEFILMNPAIATSEIESLDQAIKNRLRTQIGTNISRPHRKIMILQALGDRAIGFWYQLAFHGTPVGFSKRTHRARICSGYCESEAPDRCRTVLSIRDHAEMLIEAVEPNCDDKMQRPIWIVTGEDTVSRHHNDIFTDEQADALAAHVTGEIRNIESRLPVSREDPPSPTLRIAPRSSPSPQRP